MADCIRGDATLFDRADGVEAAWTLVDPILEAFITLAYLAAATSRVTLGTEVLVLPQRQPALVAKQVSTLDTLSGGRVRLGVGVGWQESEYEALGEDFRTRGKRADDRAVGWCWPLDGRRVSAADVGDRDHLASP